MGNIIRLTENDLVKIVKRIIKEQTPPIKDVYLLDNQGKIDSKKKVGTHQHGKGFIPNELGVKLGFSSNPTRIPDKTRMMEGMNNRFGTPPTMYERRIIKEQLKQGNTPLPQPKPQSNPRDPFIKIKQVVFYSDKGQQRERMRGWINLREWDINVEKGLNKTVQNPGKITQTTILLYGSIYRDERAARNTSGGEKVVWQFQATSGFGTFLVLQDKLFNEPLNLFFRNRYLQKNKSGVWILKVAPGAFAINNSAGIPDNLA